MRSASSAGVARPPSPSDHLQQPKAADCRAASAPTNAAGSRATPLSPCSRRNGMTPIWHAVAREAALAAEHLGSGATILGKANYAHHAHYGQAFFDLTIGIERAAKLAFVVDYALDHGGS